MQQPNEKEFQEHQEKIVLIVTTLGKNIGKKLIDALGGASKSYATLSLYPKFHLRSLNDMELVSELFQHDLDKVSEFWLTDHEKIEINKLKNALHTNSLDKRAYEDEEKITERDFSFDGSFSEHTPFTNKWGVHSALCRDQDYRNHIKSKIDAERNLQNMDRKIKLVCIEISMTLMRLDYLIGSASDIKTLHDIVSQEISFLEGLLFGIKDEILSTKEPLTANATEAFRGTLYTLADYMSMLHEHIESPICKDRVGYAYDHVQEVTMMLP